MKFRTLLLCVLLFSLSFAIENSFGQTPDENGARGQGPVSGAPSFVDSDLSNIEPFPGSERLKALFQETLSVQKTIDDAEERAQALFFLLDLQTRALDEEGGKKTFEAILDACGAISRTAVRDELFGKLAVIRNQWGRFPDAIELVKGIDDKNVRIQMLLNLVDQRIQLDRAHEDAAKNDAVQTTDSPALEEHAALIRETLESIAKEKDRSYQTAAYTLEGILRIRSDDPQGSAESFRNAIEAARGLEKVESEEAIVNILQAQAFALTEKGYADEANAVLESLEDAAQKNAAIEGIVVWNLQHQKLAPLIECFKKIADDDRLRDTVLSGIILLQCETSDPAAVKSSIEEFSPEASLREKLFEFAAVQFLRLKKYDDARSIAGESKTPELRDNVLAQIGNAYAGEKRFSEAIGLAEQIANPMQKSGLLRMIALFQLKAGDESDGKETLEKTFSEEDRAQLRELAEESQVRKEAPDPELRLFSLTEILGKQLRLYDMFGAKTTLLLMIGAAKELPNPEQRIQTLLQAIRGLAQLGAKSEAETCLNDLLHEADDLKEEQLTILGIVAAMQIEWDLKGQAKETMLKIIPLVDAKPRISDRIMTRIELAQGFQKIDDRKDATGMIETARELSRELESTGERSGALLTLCRTLIRIEAAEKAADRAH